MKRCPTCRKTYADETLNFCLEDGAPLLVANERESSRDSAATLVLSNQTKDVIAPPPTQVSIPRGAPTDVMPPTPGTIHEHPRYTAPDAHIATHPPKPRSHLITAGVTAIAILLLVLVGIGIALLMRGTGSDSEVQRGSNNTNNEANRNSSPSARTDNSTSNENANTQNRSDSSVRDSFNVTATASSTRAPLKAFSYAPANALDNSLLTAWIEGVPGPGIGEWIRCEFDREVKLNYVQLTPGYFKSAALWKQNNRLAAATLYFSDGSSRRFDFPDRMEQQRLDTGGIRTRFVRLVIEDFYPGSVDSEDTPISEMTFYREE